MKICEKCGLKQADSEVVCNRCREKLPEFFAQSTEPELPTLPEKIVGIAALTGLVAAVVLIFINRNSEELLRYWGAIWAAAFFGNCAMQTLLSNLIWENEKRKLSQKIKGAHKAEPSNYYLITRKIIIWGSFAAALIGLAFAIFR